MNNLKFSYGNNLSFLVASRTFFSCLRKVRLNGERRFYLFRNNVWMHERSYAGLSCGSVTVLEFVT